MKRKSLILISMILVMALALTLSACSMFGGGETPTNPDTEQGGTPGDGGNTEGGGNEDGESDIELNWNIITMPEQYQSGVISLIINGEEKFYNVPSISTGRYTETLTLEPTCTESGKKKYSILLDEDKEFYFELPVDPIGHEWIVTYEWADDGSSCKAIKTCKHDSTHVEYVDGIITKYISKRPNCTYKGVTKYTAKFTEKGLETQTLELTDIAINPKSHDYGDVTYEWADDGSSCKAVRVCKYNMDHKIEALGEITSVVNVEPTCTYDGSTKYTATFDVDWAKNQTKTITDIPAIGHDYGTPEYTWDKVKHICKATRTCTRDQYHYETVTGTTTSEVLIEATCTEKGTTKYTAKFNVDWAKPQSYEEKDIDLKDHTYGDLYIKEAPTLTTKGSMYKKCSVCNTETFAFDLATLLTENNTYVLDQVLVEPTGTTNGKGKYHFDFDGVTYTFESEIQRQDLSYYYNKNYWTNRKNIDNKYFESQELKDQYYNDLKSQYNIYDSKSLVDFKKSSNLGIWEYTENLYNAISSATYDIQCIAGSTIDAFDKEVFDILPFVWTTNTTDFAKKLTDYNYSVIIYDNFVFFENYKSSTEDVYNNNLFIAFKTVERIKMVNDIAYSLDMKYLIKDYGNQEYDCTLQNCEHICSYAFSPTNIDNLVIPATIKTIASYAFNHAKMIKTLVFAENSQLETIDSYAFYRLQNLKVIDIPNSVKIAKDAFGSHIFDSVSCSMDAVPAFKNKALKLTIKNGTEITDNLFVDDTTIEDITLPETLLSIGKSAFENCSNLTYIKFNNKLETISDYAFKNTNLFHIDIPESVKNIGIDPFCKVMDYIILPATIANLHENAFQSIFETAGDGSHFHIYFKSEPTMEFIKHKAFKPAFEMFMYSEIQHNTINRDKFNGYWKLNDTNRPILWENDLYLLQLRPDRDNEYFLYGFKTKAYSYNLIIPEVADDKLPITGIAPLSFRTGAVQSIQFTNNIDYIGHDAFKDFEYHEVKFPSSIKYIGDSCFTDPKNPDWGLTSIVFDPKSEIGPMDDLYIGSYVFKNAEITEIILPRANIKFGRYAFDNCAKLKKLAAYGPVTAQEHAFNGCKLIGELEGDASLCDIIYPKEVTQISPMNLLTGKLNRIPTESVYRLTIGAGVTYIKPGAFQNMLKPDSQFTIDSNNPRYKSAPENSQSIIDTQTQTLIYAQGSKFTYNQIKIVAPYSLNNFEGYIDITENTDKICNNAIADNGTTVRVYFSFPQCHADTICEENWYDTNTASVNPTYGKGLTNDPLFNYVTYNNGIAILKYKGTSTDVVIPDMINNLPVNKFYTDVFSRDSELTSVKFSKYITEIPYDAFLGCRQLKNIDLTNIEKIGRGAFEASGLINLVIPETVNYIGEHAFSQSKLESVVFNTKLLKEIPEMCFASCYSLVNVDVPEGVEIVGQRAFQYSGLKNVSFPSTLTVLQGSAFDNVSLENITCSAENQLFTSNINGEINALVYVGATPYVYDEIFSDTTTYTVQPNSLVLGSKNTIIPDSDKITTIARHAFYIRFDVEKEVIIPSSVKVIEEFAFHCNKISNIVFNEGLERLEARAFAGSAISNKNVVMPTTIKYCGYETFNTDGLVLNFKGPDISYDFAYDWYIGSVTVNWNYVA